MSISQYKPVSPFAIFGYCENGGSSEIIGNYLAAPTEFVFTPPRIMELNEISLSIVSSGNLRYDGYASIVGGLANGLLIEARSLGVISLSITFKFNYEIQSITTDYQAFNYAGTDSGIKGVINSTSFGDSARIIDPQIGDYVRVLAHDNFTALASQQVSIRGALL